jgi:hypothetical protein
MLPALYGLEEGKFALFSEDIEPVNKSSNKTKDTVIVITRTYIYIKSAKPRSLGFVRIVAALENFKFPTPSCLVKVPSSGFHEGEYHLMSISFYQ